MDGGAGGAIDLYDNVGIEGESSPGTETAATSKESHSSLEECTYFHKSIAVPNNEAGTFTGSAAFSCDWWIGS